MKKYRSLVSVVILIGIVLVFFYQTIFFGKLPVPTDTLVGLYHPWRDAYASEFPRGIPFKNFLITDPVRQQIPWRKLVIDEWKQGRVPGWNPFSFAGTSLGGNIQAAPFYPFNVIFILFSFPVAWTMLIVLQPIGAGVFFFFFLRYRGVSALASLMGALVWSFSGFSVAWLTWGTMVQTAMWLPLMLLAVDKMTEGAGRWWVVLTAAAAMQFLAGHVQIAFYCFLFSLFYFLVRLRDQKKEMRSCVVDAIKAIGAVTLLTAIAWVPLVRTFSESARAVEQIWEKPGFFLPWQHLVQFIVPDFFGNPTTLNYWGVWNWAEFVGYVGIAPVIFVGIAATTRWKQASLWVWTILVCMLFALQSPIAMAPYWFHVPFISAFQPTRLMVLIDFSLAVLAALGVDAFLHSPRRTISVLGVISGFFMIVWGISIAGARGIDAEMAKNFLVAQRNLILPTGFFIGSAVLLWGALRWMRLRRALLFIIFGLTAVDLLRFGWKFTPFTPKEYFFPETALIGFLQKQPKPFRVMSVDERILPPNVSSYYGLETIEGYDPVYSAQYERFFAAVTRGTADISPPYGFNRILTTKNIDSPFLAYLNVRYVLSLDDIDRPFLTKVFEEGQTRVYENIAFLPRVYLAESVVRAKSSQDALKQSLNTSVRSAAVVEASLDILTVPLATDEGVTITSYNANEVIMRSSTMNPRLMVILNQFNSSWRAQIDGKPAPIYRVNYIFQGLVVPPGSHTIRLYYQQY